MTFENSVSFLTSMNATSHVMGASFSIVKMISLRAPRGMFAYTFRKRSFKPMVIMTLRTASFCARFFNKSMARGITNGKNSARQQRGHGVSIWRECPYRDPVPCALCPRPQRFA
jgi:hypothetical protein